jgi:hypothetical protein
VPVRRHVLRACLDQQVSPRVQDGGQRTMLVAVSPNSMVSITPLLPEPLGPEIANVDP